MRGKKRAAGLPWLQRTRRFPSAVGFHMLPGYAAREPGGLTVAVQLQKFNKKAFQHLQELDISLDVSLDVNSSFLEQSSKKLMNNPPGRV